MLWHPTSERTPGWRYLSLAWPLREFSMRDIFFVGQDLHKAFFISSHLVSRAGSTQSRRQV